VNDKRAELLPNRDQHIAIFAPTGYGKSELARQMVSNFSDVIVIDNKREWSWGELAKADPRHYRFQFSDKDKLRRELDRIARDRTGEPVMYSPPAKLNSAGQLWAWRDTIDDICFYALRRGNTIVLFDELESCFRSGDWEYNAPAFCALVYQGRSKRSVGWFLCKRPQRVPFIILTECRKKYVFDLGSREARARAEDICRHRIPWEKILEPYRWMYADEYGMLGPFTLKTGENKWQ